MLNRKSLAPNGAMSLATMPLRRSVTHYPHLATAPAASRRTPWVPSPAWRLRCGRETANGSSVTQVLTAINTY
jgi:hypothetical protein